mmetsp:Transcript_11219/g.45234  ORF Transcript_11219/g.45234 Transcript_11219/m.45234 type:complete len:303 (-) Transcript_11219:225-1133(-)
MRSASSSARTASPFFILSSRRFRASSMRRSVSIFADFIFRVSAACSSLNLATEISRFSCLTRSSALASSTSLVSLSRIASSNFAVLFSRLALNSAFFSRKNFCCFRSRAFFLFALSASRFSSAAAISAIAASSGGSGSTPYSGRPRILRSSSVRSGMYSSKRSIFFASRCAFGVAYCLMHTAVYFFGPNAGAGSNPSGTSIPDTGSTQNITLPVVGSGGGSHPSPFFTTHALASSARKSNRASRSSFEDDLPQKRERGSGRLARSCFRALRSSESLKSLSAVAFACAFVSRPSFHLEGARYS